MYVLVIRSSLFELPRCIDWMQQISLVIQNYENNNNNLVILIYSSYIYIYIWNWDKNYWFFSLWQQKHCLEVPLNFVSFHLQLLSVILVSLSPFLLFFCNPCSDQITKYRWTCPIWNWTVCFRRATSRIFLNVHSHVFNLLQVARGVYCIVTSWESIERQHCYPTPLVFDSRRKMLSL